MTTTSNSPTTLQYLDKALAGLRALNLSHNFNRSDHEPNEASEHLFHGARLRALRRLLPLEERLLGPSDGRMMVQ